MLPALESTALADRTRKRINRRLMPFLFVLYIIAFLDRINVSFAGLDMTRELGFSDQVFGFGSRHLLCWLCAAGDSRIASGGGMERAQMDRAHYDFLGAGGFTNRSDPHGRPILLGAVRAGSGRGGFFPRPYRLYHALVS